MRSQRTIQISLEQGDVLDVDSDVLALKFAQQHYGVDRIVAEILRTRYPSLSELLPKVSGFRLLQTKGDIKAKSVLFVGVKPLREFGYPEIRDFGRKVLASLAGEAPEIEDVALTLHGAGYGLDEREAFEAEIGGLLDAIISSDFPPKLKRITIVERNHGRAARLHKVLQQVIPAGAISANAKEATHAIGNSVDESLRLAGYASASKPLLFVAMPFAESMDDIFHYGIQNAAYGAGFLCERADQAIFTGDILDWIKRRIAAAQLVVADLSLANPNVYLEVGYAWSCGKRTVLIVRDTADLKFDVKGQRCLVYTSIRTLEEMLRRELSTLADSATTVQ